MEYLSFVLFDRAEFLRHSVLFWVKTPWILLLLYQPFGDTTK